MNDVLFLLTVRFATGCPRISSCMLPTMKSPAELSAILSRGADMTTLQDNAVELASPSELLPPAPLLLLAPGEPRAPIAILSPAKRNALVACFNAGGLHKRDGAWHGLPGGKPISGMTTADLARDGMLTVTTNHRIGSARLTERGNWFARTLLCDGTTGTCSSAPMR